MCVEAPREMEGRSEVKGNGGGRKENETEKAWASRDREGDKREKNIGRETEGKRE